MDIILILVHRKYTDMSKKGIRMIFIELEWLLSPFKGVGFGTVTFLFLVKSTVKEQTH